MERFAGFYMGTDPQADNDDPAHRVIRSMFNGSRGPLMRKSTGLDWAGDSIEVEGRFKPGHGERNYAEMVAHFEDYNDVVGDHPLNLSTTTLAFNAIMLSGDAAYKDWLVNDVDAWRERTAANDGIIPTNIGLDGSLGGASDGKWYGGVYGWGFAVTVPQTGAAGAPPLLRVPGALRLWQWPADDGRPGLRGHMARRHRKCERQRQGQRRADPLSAHARR